MSKLADMIGLRLGIEPEAMILLSQAKPLRAPPGTVLFRPGDACPAYVLVEQGSIVVRGASAEGRELLFYRVRPGQTCFQTTLCLLTNGRYSAEGVVEEALEALLVPAETFDALLGASRAFRRYAFVAFADRLQGLTGQLAALAFQPLSARLATALLSRDGDTVSATHEALARELGVAREAVSRILGEWEREGLIALGRGKITLSDRAGLAAKQGD